jgi:hypothetical protein
MATYKLPSGLASIEWQAPPAGEKEFTLPCKAADRNKALHEALEQCLLLEMQRQLAIVAADELIKANEELAALRQQVKNLTSDTNNTAKMLGRRVDIENHLLQIYQGTMPMLSRQDCKVLALRLGTPKEYWGDYIKQYEFIAADSSKAVH